MRPSAYAIVVLVAAILAGVCCTVAFASPAERFQRALDTWDLGAARRALEEADAGGRKARTSTAWGYLAFLEGNYSRAEALLSRRMDRDARVLIQVVRETMRQTRDFATVNAPSNRFEFRYATGRDDVLIPYLAEAGDAAYGALVTRLGNAPATPIRVEILPSIEALSAVTQLSVAVIQDTGTVALCKFNKVMMLSPAALPYGYPFADTLAHELVHFFAIRRAGEDVPVWFQEGLARYLEPIWRGGVAGALSRGMQDLLARAVTEKTLLDPTMLSGSLTQLDGIDAVASAFAQLSSLIGFIERSHGPGTLPRLLDAMASGDPEDALRRVTGRTLAQVVSAWSEDLSSTGITAGSNAELVWQGMRSLEPDKDASLTADQRAALRLADLLAATGRHKAAVKQYQTLIEGWGRPAPLVIERLARALLADGAAAETLVVLDRAGLDEVEFASISRARGLALVALGRTMDALGPLRIAVRTDPFDPEVHAALARIHSERGETALAEREQRLAGIGR